MQKNQKETIRAFQTTVIISFSAWLLIPLFLLMTSRCNTDENTVYRRLRSHADEITVINTHEHQRWPEEYGDHKFSFYHLIALSYSMTDLISAGSEGYDLHQLDTLTPDECWGKYGKALDYCRNTSYYSYLIKGFRILYDFNEPYFTEKNISLLSAQVEEKYKDYRSWFDKAFHKAGFELMFLDRSWYSWNLFKTDDVSKQNFALVFHIDLLVSQAARKPKQGLEPDLFYKKAADEGFSIVNLNDYLAYCNHLFSENINENKAVCLKNLLAYNRMSYYEDVPFEEAFALFNKNSAQLTPVEVKKLEDFMFHWIIRKSIEFNIPIQIHTGYFATNGSVLENGYPLRLNNLFLKYPEAEFILFHGSFPWTGEFAALGKMFPNVYLDLVWLPQISLEEAVHSLDVMLDCVPYNKFFWGGDCKFIEGSVGALEYGKDVVAEVLAKRVERGVLTEDVARDIIGKIFRENAVTIFNLEERLEF